MLRCSRLACNMETSSSMKTALSFIPSSLVIVAYFWIWMMIVWLIKHNHRSTLHANLLQNQLGTVTHGLRTCTPMQSLLAKDNDEAISAGVNLMLHAGTTAAICQLQALSPSGRCKTFDESADGYGRGEGLAAIVLQASQGINKAIAIIRGSVANQVRFIPHMR